MNAVHRLRPNSRASSLRDALKSCLFLAVLLANLAGVLTIALHAGDPQRIALGATSMSLLLAALP